MNELTLNEHIIPVNINGMIFGFIPDSQFALCLSDLAKEASQKAEMCRFTGSKNGSEAVSFLIRAIDKLLGEGTVESIFGENDADPFDLCEIISLISDAFYEYKEQRLRALRGDIA